MSYVVLRSELIETLDEARAYYRERLVGAHTIGCHGRRVTIVFEPDATHLYSDDPGNVPVDLALQVARAIGRGRKEIRRFNLARAHLMDRVLPAITSYTVSVPGTSTARGREKRMLHGPPLPDGQYMRVVLRPGPGEAFTCVSAYPVTVDVWRAAFRAKRAKFPP